MPPSSTPCAGQCSTRPARLQAGALPSHQALVLRVRQRRGNAGSQACAFSSGLALGAPGRLYLAGVAAARPRREVATAASAAGSTAAGGDAAPLSPPAGGVIAAARRQLGKLDGLWGRFLPMVALFFCLAFVNTLLDSIKDSLVITAVGGGTEVLPFLTVYAVLPASVLFLLAYSYATQRFSRAALFNAIVLGFMAFYAAFAFAYPAHQALHAHPLAERMAAVLPPGLGGLVGMVRNWTFTLFYCCSELWGDVCLSLLFWGLANEITPMRDAPLLYPLFGIGANVAQTMAGHVLRLFSRSAHCAHEYGRQLQAVLGLVLLLAVAVLGLHAHITRAFPRTHEGFSRRQQQREWRNKQRLRKAAAAAAAANGNGGKAGAQAGPACAVAPEPDAESRLSPREAMQFLAESPQIRCLAIMALAQGVSTSVVDLAWKWHLRMLYPTPGAYSAFMGEVAMWTGVVTGSLMFLSPLLFDALGWEGVAAATPRFMITFGTPFFLGCIAFQSLWAGSPAGGAVLQVLVLVGALLQVFSRGAKFSLFKPAEEMVYIGLDEESRTKGKAAIDVVGAQSGKSVGSMLQQVLLLASGSAGIGGMLPFLMLTYFGVLKGWLYGTATLGRYYDPSTHHAEDNEALPVELLQTMDDLDSPDDGGGGLPQPARASAAA